jgi:hypothetical protein
VSSLRNTALDVLIAVWLTLCAVTFWGPYVGVVLSAGWANALYAVFLLSVIGVVLIQWLKSRTDAEMTAKALASTQAAGESDSSNGGN